MKPILKLAFLAATLLTTQIVSAQDLSISNAEAEKLSIQLDTSLSNGNPEVLNRLIDFPAFIIHTHSRSRIINNFDTLTKIATSFGLFHLGDINTDFVKNGSYHFVRGYLKNEEVHLLFRLLGDEGLDYQDITLVRVKDSIKAADIFSYQLGESYATLFAASIQGNDPGDFHSSLTAKEKYSGIFEFAYAHKNYSVAKSAYEKLDEQTQNEKHFALQFLQVCKQLDPKPYKKALDHYASLFPNDPTSYLLMTQVYAGTKDYDHYIMAIDRLDTLVSIDPVLNYLRGNIAMKMGSLHEARDFYQLTFDYDPGFWQNTRQLVACNVMINELVQASAVINSYKRTPGFRASLIESLYASYPVLK